MAIIEFEQWADEVHAIVDEAPEADDKPTSLAHVLRRAGIEFDPADPHSSIAAQGWRFERTLDTRLALGQRGCGELRLTTGRARYLVTKLPKATMPSVVNESYAFTVFMHSASRVQLCDALQSTAHALANARESIVGLRAELTDAHRTIGERGLELDKTKRMLDGALTIAERYAAEPKSLKVPELREGWAWRRDEHGWSAEACDGIVAWAPNKIGGPDTSEYGAGGPADVHKAVRQRNMTEAMFERACLALRVDARNTPETRERIRKALAANPSACLILELDADADPCDVDPRDDSSEVVVHEGTEDALHSATGRTIGMHVHAPTNIEMPQAGVVATQVAQALGLSNYLAAARAEFERTIAVVLPVHDSIMVDAPKLPDVDAYVEMFKRGVKSMNAAFAGISDLVRERVTPAMHDAIDAMRTIDDVAVFDVTMHATVAQAISTVPSSLRMHGRASALAGSPGAWGVQRAEPSTDPQNASTTEAKGPAYAHGTESGRVRTRVCGKRHPTNARAECCKLGYVHTGTCTDGRYAWYDTHDGRAPAHVGVDIAAGQDTSCIVIGHMTCDHERELTLSVVKSRAWREGDMAELRRLALREILLLKDADA